MRYVEYGKENDNIILLLHGGGLSWWNYEEVAKSLQDDYHIILPKSAEIIHQALPESVLHVLPELYHGEFSINKGIDYANKIREINGY